MQARRVCVHNNHVSLRSKTKYTTNCSAKGDGASPGGGLAAG